MHVGEAFYQHLSRLWFEYNKILSGGFRSTQKRLIKWYSLQFFWCLGRCFPMNLHLPPNPYIPSRQAPLFLLSPRKFLTAFFLAAPKKSSATRNRGRRTWDRGAPEKVLDDDCGWCMFGGPFGQKQLEESNIISSTFVWQSQAGRWGNAPWSVTYFPASYI